MPTSTNPLLQRFAADLLTRAQKVKVVFFDIDGVMTDGGIYLSASPDSAGAESGVMESIKRFHTLDGLGLKLIRLAGITPVVISGRDSPVLRARLQSLSIDHSFLGQEDKLPCALQALESLSLTWQQAACMGDDWPDLPVMTRCQLAVAPPQSHPEVLNRAHHITQKAAGNGAVREACDLLLTAHGRYDALLNTYVNHEL